MRSLDVIGRGVSKMTTVVPEGLREKIFEPFFTTKPQGEGKGLVHRPGWRVFVVRLPGA